MVMESEDPLPYSFSECVGYREDGGVHGRREWSKALETLLRGDPQSAGPGLPGTSGQCNSARGHLLRDGALYVTPKHSQP